MRRCWVKIMGEFCGTVIGRSIMQTMRALVNHLWTFILNVILWLPLFAVAGYYGLNAVLQRDDSAQIISNAVSKYLPGALVRFDAANVRVGWKQAVVSVENFRVVAGKNSLTVPKADFWVQPTGLVAALHRPTVILFGGTGAQMMPPLDSHWAVLGEQANIQWHDEENQIALTLANAQLKLRHDDGLLQISAHENDRRQTDIAAHFRMFAHDLRGTVHIALENWSPPAAVPLQWQSMRATAQIKVNGGQWRAVAAGELQEVKHHEGKADELHWHATTHWPPSATATLAARVTLAAAALSLAYLPKMPQTNLHASGMLRYAPSQQTWQWNDGMMLAQNADGLLNASLTVSGRMTEIVAADLRGRLINVPLAVFSSYTSAGKLRDWFKNALPGGTMQNAHFSWRGQPADFPFSDDGGDFALTAKFVDGELLIGDGWPAAQSLHGHLIMRGDDLEINGNGDMAGLAARAQVRLPNVLATNVSLYLLAKAKPDTLANYTRAARQFPPLQATVEQVLNDFAASGHGRFMLSLTVPLAAPTNTRAEGFLRVNDGRLQADNLPALTAVVGGVHFSNQGASGQLLGILAGQLATVNFNNMQVTVRSVIDAQTIFSFLGDGDGSVLGSIPFEFRRDERRTVIVSSLRGVRFDYLKLLNKDVTGKAMFGVTLAIDKVRTRLQLSGNTLYLTVPGQEVAWGANAAASQPFIHDLPSNFSLSGHGRLRLSLMVPLAAPTKMRAYGLLQVNDGRLQAGSLPALTTVAGNVHFSNKNAKGQLSGIWAGQLATVDFDNTQVTVRSAIEAQTALSFVDIDDLPIFGIVPFNLQRDERRTVMVSSLHGVRFDYPAPLNKEAMEKATLSITAAAGMVRARLQLRRNTLHLTAQKRGVDLAINAISLPPPARGLQVHGTMADVDVGLWLNGGDTTNAQIAVSLTLVRANFADVIQQTMILHSPFVVRDERQIAITADSVAGVARLGKKHLYLDLARLSLSPPQSEGGEGDDLVFSLLRQMTISLTTQRLQMGSVTLGALQLNGAPMDANAWNLNTLVLMNESATLTAVGGYFDDTATVSVRLWTSDAPAFLQIFAVSNVVSEGAAEMGGDLTLRRAPTGFSLSDLHGQLKMRASDLRYLKGGESVVGLLAIFSPQSLLSLGFVELGKEGTFINNIDGDIILNGGKAEVHEWKMKNDDFSISMEGDTDLAMRTLNLHGRVRPGNRLLKAGSFLSIGVAGAAAVQPLSLVAYWLAGKVFERPLAEIGAYNYTITGTWDSPIYKESGVTLKQSASDGAEK